MNRLQHCRFLVLLVVVTGINILTVHAQSGVAINTTGTVNDASALLDVNASDKGLLIPRVALTATNLAAPVVSPAHSLMVFNTATSGSPPTGVSPGYYYWDSVTASWIRLQTSAGTSGTARTIFRTLTGSVTNSVTTSSAATTTLFNFNFTPTEDTVMVQFSAAARISASSGMSATVLQKWAFRLTLNGTLQKLVYAHPNTNGLGGGTASGDLVVSFTLPVAVNPGSSNNIIIDLAGLFTVSGSATLRINPANTTEFANIVIYDMPSN